MIQGGLPQLDQESLESGFHRDSNNQPLQARVSTPDCLTSLRVRRCNSPGPNKKYHLHVKNIDNDKEFLVNRNDASVPVALQKFFDEGNN